MSEYYNWWPVSEPLVDQAMSDGFILAAHFAKRTSELSPIEQARLAEILEMEHDEAFTRNED